MQLFPYSIVWHQIFIQYTRTILSLLICFHHKNSKFVTLYCSYVHIDRQQLQYVIICVFPLPFMCDSWSQIIELYVRQVLEKKSQVTHQSSATHTQIEENKKKIVLSYERIVSRKSSFCTLHLFELRLHPAISKVFHPERSKNKYYYTSRIVRTTKTCTDTI